MDDDATLRAAERLVAAFRTELTEQDRARILTAQDELCDGAGLPA